MRTDLPDILAPGLSVVFCGLNPGLKAAAAGHHFVGRGNRFWRVIHLAGFTPTEIAPAQDASALSFGLGLTTVVDRPTASAAEVAGSEFVAGSVALRRKIARYAPRNLAFLGKAAFSAIEGTRDIAWGRQPAPIVGATVWVLPNPSGRNLGFSLDALVESYGRLHRALDQSAAGATR
jgi:TDG/mug DNA glycosylase family protein